MTSSPEFFAPAPLRRSSDADADAGGLPGRSRTAVLSLLRVIAVLVGLLWPVLVIFTWYRGSADAGIELSARNPAFWVAALFLVCAALQLVAGIRHRWRWYMVTFRLSGFIYLTVLAMHLGALVFWGGSPLEELDFTDYAFPPVASLMLALPRALGLPLCVGVLLLVSSVSQGLPLSVTHLVESLWFVAVQVPYLLLVLAAVEGAREIDRAATVRRHEALKIAGSRLLRLTEVRFMGYLHDKVLQHLVGVRLGLTEPVAPDPPLTDALTDGDDPRVHLPRSLPRAVAELGNQLHTLDPGLDISLPDAVPTRATVPAVPMDVLRDAAVEVLGNSLRHAPHARRRAELLVDVDDAGECTAVRLSITDDGPGFDPAAVDPGRAGLRVSVLGRMRSTPGSAVDLDSAPGAGTRVQLTWEREAKECNEHLGVSVEWLAERLNGLGRVFTPAFALFAFLAVATTGLLQDHADPPVLFLAALLSLVPVFWGLTRGRRNRLDNLPTLMVVAGILGFAVFATAERLPLAENWPYLWYTEPFAIMCGFLAIRARTAAAWGTFVAGLVPILGFAWNTPVADQLLSYSVLNMAVLVTLGTMFPAGFRWALRSLSVELRADGQQATDQALATSQRNYLRSSGAWLQQQLDTALDPAESREQRRRHAALLELRLRDAIRSPGFDETATNRAAWRAREHGVTVQLRDDRRDEAGQDQHPLPDAHAQLHRLLVAELTAPDGPVDSVNARIFPPGRSTYATIVVHAGETTRRTRIPADATFQHQPGDDA